MSKTKSIYGFKFGEILLKEEVDYLIIGGSVAGSLLAAKFAKHGSTIFIDKYIPGTYMNCGGGMPEKTFHYYNVNVPHIIVPKSIMKINNKNYSFPCNYLTVNRSEFDFALHKKAIKAGAVFKKMIYTGHNPDTQIAYFKKNHKKYEIKFKKLIIAYGFHPNKEPFSGNKRYFPTGIARVEVIDTPSPYKERFYFEIYKTTPAYTWIFDMPGGKSNIGTGGFKHEKEKLINLNDFKKEEDIDKKILLKGGGVLPLRPVWTIQKGNIFLYGDSAGMLNALNGEGLMHIAKFADQFTNNVIKGRNLNFTWRTSKRFYFLLLAAIFLKSMNFFNNTIGVNPYPFFSKLVCRVRTALDIFYKKKH